MLRERLRFFFPVSMRRLLDKRGRHRTKYVKKRFKFFFKRKPKKRLIVLKKGLNKKTLYTLLSLEKRLRKRGLFSKTIKRSVSFTRLPQSRRRKYLNILFTQFLVSLVQKYKVNKRLFAMRFFTRRLMVLSRLVRSFFKKKGRKRLKIKKRFFYFYKNFPGLFFKSVRRLSLHKKTLILKRRKYLNRKLRFKYFRQLRKSAFLCIRRRKFRRKKKAKKAFRPFTFFLAAAALPFMWEPFTGCFIFIKDLKDYNASFFPFI